jgi:hypothetical protein
MLRVLCLCVDSHRVHVLWLVCVFLQGGPHGACGCAGSCDVAAAEQA